MEFSADSRWLGPSHWRAQTIVGAMAVSWTFTGQQDARAVEAAVSPASPSGRSKSHTSVSGGSPFRCFHEVTRLQAALTSLGPNDHAERAALEVSLRKAQKQATAPLVAEQAEQTAMFIERAKKRLSNAEEWVQWAQGWRSECAKDLNDAELRLQRFRAEAEGTVAYPPAPPDCEAEVRRLRQQVTELPCQKQFYSRVQASHSVQSSVEAAQMVQERVAK